jgi:hypothetical protein
MIFLLVSGTAANVLKNRTARHLTPHASNTRSRLTSSNALCSGTGIPTPHVSNTMSRFVASKVRGSQRGQVAHWQSSLLSSGRGEPSRRQLQFLTLASNEYGCGRLRVGVSQ